MAKYSNDTGLDQALAWFADCDALHICSAQPTTYAEATSTYSLGSVALTAGDGNGDFTIGNGSVDGRALTVAAQTVASASGNGTVTHVAIVQSTGTTLRYVTTTASQAVVSGAQVDVASWSVTLRDPT